MAVLDIIIEDINAQLKANVFDLPAYDSADMRGIASQFGEKKGSVLVKIVPGTIDANSQITIVDFSLDKPLISYHRISNRAYQYDKKNSVGDGYLQTQVVDMIMVFCMSRAILPLSDTEMEETIVNNFNRRPAAETISNAGARDIRLFPVSSTIDSIKIFGEEFKQVEYFIKPEQVLLSLKYKVQIISDCSCAQ
jgi:hypothetical protein